MKKIFFIILIIMPALLFSQWQWNNPSTTNQDLYSVEYISDDQLFATGRYGTRLLSNDNGESWFFSCDTAQVQPNREVQFVNENDGWIVGGNFIYQTENGGDNWNRQIVQDELYCLYFIDENIGWASGINNLYKTIDGGNNWSIHCSFDGLLSPPDYAETLDIQFINENHGYVILGDDLGCYFCSTADGGTSWDIKLTENWGVFYNFHFIDSNTGWMLGNYYPYGTWILKTEDGGLNWSTTTYISSNTSMNDILFKDLNEGWICGGDGDIFHTMDGGYNWTIQETNVTNYLTSMDIDNNGDIIVVGVEGIILESIDNGQTWDQLSNKFTESNFYATYFIDDNNGWATGFYQKIYHTNDGGLSWELQHPGISDGKFWDIFFIDNNNGWIVGGNNDLDSTRYIIHTNNGGVSWTYQNVPANTSSLQSVYFKDNYIGWAVGLGGTLLFTDDGGNNWNKIETNTYASLHDICFINSQIGWICGYYVTITTTDGGANWELKPSDQYGECMDFINEDIGWIAGGKSISRTTDGGITWDQYITHFYIKDIVFLDEDIGYAASSTNTENIMYTLNGGVTWHKCFPHLQNSMWSLSFSENKGWAVGESGTILVNEQPFIVDISEHDNSLTQSQNFKIYPNPANNVISIQNSGGDIINVSVYSITGQRIIHNKRINDKLDVSSLKSGLYIIEVNTRTGLYRQKIIIK